MSITVSRVAAIEATLDVAFYARTSFSGLTAYYVDQSHPSASDSNPGTSASLPFLTLAPITTIGPGVILYINSGTYVVPTGGLSMVGGGTSSPAVISGYPGTLPILEGRPFSTLGGTVLPTVASEIRVRQIIDVSGSNVVIKNLQLQYGFRHNVVFRGHYGVCRDCTLKGAFEDSIKIANTVGDFDGANYGLIERNDFSGWASQGVDLFGASYWMIRNNVFHAPQVDPITFQIVANATSIKGGGSNYVVSSNRVYNVVGQGAHGSAGMSFGAAGLLAEYRVDGSGNYLPSCNSATVINNTICGTSGPVFQVLSASGCNFYQNYMNSCAQFMQLGLDPDVRAANPTTTAPLPTCSSTQVAENIFTGGAGSTGYLVFHPSDTVGFVSERNRYRRISGHLVNNSLVSQSAFAAAVGTDSTSAAY